MVEFSFTFGVFLSLLLMAADFGSIGYQWTVLQYAANQGARIGSLGYIGTVDPDTGDNFKSTGMTDAILQQIKDKTAEIADGHDQRRVDTIKSIVIVVASQYGVSLTKDDVVVYDKNHTAISNDPSTGEDTQSDDMMYVRTQKTVTLPVLSNTIQKLLGATPQNLSFTLIGEALSKNEPFRVQ